MPRDETDIRRPRRVTARVSVDTSEQIQFTYELAGPGPRALAYLVDLSIRAGGVLAAVLVISLATGWAAPGLTSGLALLVLFAVEWGYHTIVEWLWNGVTPGKKALGIRVVRTDGVAIDFVRSAMRNLLRAADIFPLFYAAGLATMLAGGSFRRLGDLAADTMVIREEPARLRDLPPLPRDAVHVPSGSVRSLSLKERDLALIDEFFRRRHLFSRDRARELAEILARPAAARLGLGDRDPELVLAGLLVAGHELRSSWFGRSSAQSIAAPGPGAAGGSP